MIRLFVFLAFLVLAGLGLYTMLHNPIPVSFQVLGDAGETTMAFLVLALLVASLVLFLFWRLVDFLFRLPKKIRRSRARARFRKGFDMLEAAMASEAEGVFDKAQKQALDAKNLFEERSLMARLVLARSSFEKGDDQEAQEHYRTMLTDKKTAMIARRGLSRMALARGDRVEAELYAREALEEAPKTRWAFETVFKISRACSH